jgi:hypothetical protein
MTTNILKKELLTTLKNNIRPENYLKTEVWIEDYFGDEWEERITNKIESNDKLELKGTLETDDIENIKIMHAALKGNDPAQLTEERFWAYLTHKVFYEYMTKRWLKPNITDRYFVDGISSRGLLRNGMSRLWFIGHLTYDESRDNPYELTELLKGRVISDIFERPTVASNKNLAVGVLELIQEDETIKDNLRDLMKYFTRISGLTRLDSFEKDELKDMAKKYMKINHP